MAKLILHTGNGSEEYPLNGAITLGRQKGNTIRLSEVKASRNHARILASGTDFLLEDLRSSNGTRVNGHKVRRHSLRHGDTIQIGATRLVFDAPELQDSARSARTRAKTRDPLIGKKLGGYQILSKLGQGGMGTVYKANQISMDREIALKVLKGDLSKSREFVKGFLREARVAGQLTHPALVQVHDFGEASGTLYFSMEWIDGESIYAKIKREGKLNVETTLDIAIAVAEALAHIDTHRVVHQDVKPHNILMDKHGHVKLTDLGLATVTGRERQRRGGKASNAIMGTPHYMAPEQSQKGAIDARTDLYAFGATLFHMLTGRVPFEGPNSLVILTQHVINKRPDPRQYDVTIPKDLSELIVQMMAVEPDERPAHPKEVVTRLKQIRSRYLRERSAASKKKGRGAGVVKKRAVLSRPSAPGGPMIVEEGPAPSARASARGLAHTQRETAVQDTLFSVLKVGAGVVALIVAWTFIKPMLRHKTSPGPSRVASPAPAVPDPPDPPGNGVSGTAKTAAPAGGARPAPPPGGKDVRPEEVRAFQQVLEARDRAMQSNNFAGARTALRDYLRQARPGPLAEKARKEQRETEKVIGDVVGQMLKEAEEAAAAKNYRLAAANCTRLISADPRGDAARKAKDLMRRSDRESEGRYKAILTQADRELRKGALNQAMRIAGDGLGALGGTKWAEDLSARQLQLARLNVFLKACERARRQREASGKTTPVQVAGLSGNKVSAQLKKMDGLILTTVLGGITLPYSLRKMDPDDIYQLLTKLGRDRDHLALANLFLILKKDKIAKTEIERALKTPRQAERAAQLAARLSGVTNLHAYDFSKWQHQTDWEAASGAWATKNDRYVLESPEGGDTVLNPDAIGGPFSARNARISFTFEPRQPGKGYFIAAEFGTPQRNVSVLFNAEGYTLQVHTGETASASGAWKPHATRVELAFQNGQVALVLDGKKDRTLRAADLDALRGTLRFRVRETACAFDDVLLRNVK